MEKTSESVAMCQQLCMSLTSAAKGTNITDFFGLKKKIVELATGNKELQGQKEIDEGYKKVLETYQKALQEMDPNDAKLAGQMLHLGGVLLCGGGEVASRTRDVALSRFGFVSLPRYPEGKEKECETLRGKLHELHEKYALLSGQHKEMYDAIDALLKESGFTLEDAQKLQTVFRTHGEASPASVKGLFDVDNAKQIRDQSNSAAWVLERFIQAKTGSLQPYPQDKKESYIRLRQNLHTLYETYSLDTTKHGDMKAKAKAELEKLGFEENEIEELRDIFKSHGTAKMSELKTQLSIDHPGGKGGYREQSNNAAWVLEKLL